MSIDHKLNPIQKEKASECVILFFASRWQLSVSV